MEDVGRHNAVDKIADRTNTVQSPQTVYADRH